MLSLNHRHEKHPRTAKVRDAGGYAGQRNTNPCKADVQEHGGNRVFEIIMEIGGGETVSIWRRIVNARNHFSSEAAAEEGIVWADQCRYSNLEITDAWKRYLHANPITHQ